MSPLDRASFLGLILPSSGRQMALNQVKYGGGATERPRYDLVVPGEWELMRGERSAAELSVYRTRR